jgi:hypothetical protein
VPDTLIRNVWFYEDERKLDVILAGPPCRYFTTANTKTRNPERGMALVRACKFIIDQHPEAVWLLENVRGSVRYISKELGPPTVNLNPYWFWGNALDGMLASDIRGRHKGDPVSVPYVKHHADGRAYIHRWDDGSDSAKKARWAIEVSEAVRECALARKP